MKIILDAMGGDNAPEAPVLGALDAVKQYGADIILVGRGEAILEVLKKNGLETLPKGIEIAHADDVVDMHDDPGTVLHKRKNSSMVIGLKMLADGKGDAFVSAGSTGALLTGATLLVKRVRGIRRASMAPAMPTKAGHKVIVCDCGANAECTPEFLLQFGLVASAYSKYTLGVENPRGGLLNFTGNVEARDVPLGAVDVVVCDGFNGNILIKSIEGTAMFMGSMLKRMFKKNVGSKLGYLLCKSGVKDLMKLLDYREIGGTQFLGIKKPVIKAHGSSDALAFRNAVKQAMTAAEGNFTTQLEQTLAALKGSEADA